MKAYVTEGEEVLTLRPEERGTQKLFVPHKYNSKRKWEPSLMEWCCVKRCTNQEWTDMFERLREVSRKIGVKNAGQRMAGLGKVAWRKRRGNLSYQQGRDWTLPSTESLNCGSLFWKPGTWTHTKHCVFVKSDTSQLKGRKVRMSLLTELMTLGQVSLAR